jgi:dihydropteroate synthase
MALREWKLARSSLRYGERTLLMGVLNITPDSFSDGGKFFSPHDAVAHAEQMIAEGADIIDVGGESTRPGSEFVSEEEELRRVTPVIEKVAALSSVPVSIDTTKPTVARAACEAGAQIINDISGLRFDADLAAVAKSMGAGLLLMHSRGTPKDMQQIPFAVDVFADLVEGLRNSVSMAEERGVPRENIAIDPGIGFGKSVEQNLEIIRRLRDLSREFADLPIVIGTSRKSFLGKLLNGASADERLYGTIATVVASVLNGAHIVRVHDVKAAVDAVTVADAVIKRNG